MSREKQTETPSRQVLQNENEGLQRRLAEAEETLRAIQQGEVDALVVTGPEGTQVFTLKGAEYPYRVLVETMNEGTATLIADAQHTIFYANQRLATLLRTQIEGLFGASFLTFVAPESRAEFAELIATKQADGRSAELALIARDGTRVPVLASLSSLQNEPTPSICLVVADLTEQKRTAGILAMQEQLRASEERYRSIVSQTLSGIIESDITGKFLTVNDHFCTLVGYSRAELLSGMRLQEILHADDSPESQAGFQQLVSEATPLEIERQFVRKDGSLIWVYNHVSAICDAEGKPRSLVAVVLDITERKRIEQEREALLEREQQARELAENANRMKDEFLALVSHELRSPLNAMLGWTRLLRGNPDPMVMKAVEIVERNARAQQQLIEDLLDSARIITGKLRLDVQPLDLLSIVRAAVDVIRPAAEAKRITLRTAYQLAAEQITGDADRLQQVIWNLLSNAVKFTPEGGQIMVRVERRDPHLCITVSDTGKGIKPQLLPHVFDRFRQDTDAGGGRRLGGLGLGLSLVKQLVELHGGEVSVISAGEGRGATFIVALPLRAVRGELAENRVHARPLKMADRLVSLAQTRILVVDDEVDARHILAEVFTEYRAEVRTVGSSSEAIAVLTHGEWLPDVLISDIGMPEEDGYALLRRIRALPIEQGRNLPAIALTAYSRLEDRMQALEAGFQMYLAKPVEPLELALTVASLIEQQELAASQVIETRREKA